MSTIDSQRVWLERIMTSPIIGFVVKDETGTLMIVDGDPELRLALIEWQTQRIRELVRSEATSPPPPVSYPVLSDILPADGSGGQAADDAAFGHLARRMANAGRATAGTDHNTPSFPGS